MEAPNRFGRVLKFGVPAASLGGVPKLIDLGGFSNLGIQQDGRLVWEGFQIERGSLIWGFNKTAGGWFGRGPSQTDCRDLKLFVDGKAVGSQ